MSALPGNNSLAWGNYAPPSVTSIGSQSLYTTNISTNSIGPASNFSSGLSVQGSNGKVAADISPNGEMKLIGEKADLLINGVSLSDTLKKIQQRLDILIINPELEDKWNELAELGQQYRELEAKLLEHEKVLKILES